MKDLNDLELLILLFMNKDLNHKYVTFCGDKDGNHIIFSRNMIEESIKNNFNNINIKQDLFYFLINILKDEKINNKIIIESLNYLCVNNYIEREILKKEIKDANYLAKKSLSIAPNYEYKLHPDLLRFKLSPKGINYLTYNDVNIRENDINKMGFYV